jgi:hypothetical protein
VLNVVHTAPEQHTHTQSRWTLALLQQSIAWLQALDTGSVCRLLKRLGIRYKRGRLHLHSPDPDYTPKVEAIQTTLAAVLAEQEQAALENRPARLVLLYLDEAGYLSHPTLSQAYAAVGRDQALAELSAEAPRQTRVVATLDHSDARVVCHRQERITTACLVRFWRQVRQAYPHAERIYVVLDNWPVHYHHQVLAALEVQLTPFALRTPGSWCEGMDLRNEQGRLVQEQELTPEERLAARRRWHAQHGRADALPIQFLPLPTYSPWLNPIEKLWRWSHQQLTHMHRNSHTWPVFGERLDTWLAQFANGSPALRRYTGLLRNELGNFHKPAG